MKVLALERETEGVCSEAFAGYLREEAAQVWRLYQDGVIREIYFRTDRPGAVLIVEAPSVDEARQWLATLPLVLNGLIEFDLIPLAPYPGFARLFA